MKKTNAMRILDSNKINYEILIYDKEKAISGKEVANILNEDENYVFKTLVTISNKGEHFVFVVPVNGELDLKKAAKVSNSKKIEMIHQKDLLPLTGYVHGGCSPIGMKKEFKSFIHKSAEELNYFYVSGGKLGMQIKLNPRDLIKLIDMNFSDIIKE